MGVDPGVNDHMKPSATMKTFQRCATVLVAGATLLAATIAPSQAQDDAALPSLLGDDRVVIGGGLPFGLYFPIAGTLCRTLENPDSGSCAVAPLSDSAAALQALRAGKVDLAIVQSDWLHHAVNGTSRFQDAGPAPDLTSIAALHGEAFVFATRTTTPPLTMADLDGRRVETGPDNSYRGLLGQVALNAARLDEDDLAVLGKAPLTEAIAALCANGTDAVALMAAHPTEPLTAAASQCDAVPMSFDAEMIDKLLRLLPGYAEMTLPTGTYSTQTSPVKTVGVRAVLVATRDSDPALIGKITSALKANAARIAASHPVLAGFNLAEMRRASAFAPLHPAAAEVLGTSAGAE